MENKTLEENINDFIRYKRCLGYVYIRHAQHLNDYKKFMQNNFPTINIPNKEGVDAFLNQYKNKYGVLYNIITTLREFSRLLINIRNYSNVYLIPSKQLPKLFHEAPYFLSKEEIGRFFAELDSICSSQNEKCGKSHVRNLVFPALFRFFYCCGVRPKEGRILKRCDVNLKEGYIDIMQSKGPKNRRIYISTELNSYLKNFDDKINTIYSERTYFFAKNNDKNFSKSYINHFCSKIWKSIIQNTEDKIPRLYDFRHHFAWSNINKWVLEGKDPMNMLPYLMNYMGHNCIKHTLYYFWFVPDFYPEYKKLSHNLNDIIPEVEDDNE